ncbi:MAG: ribosome maturation factor RimM [Tissierellia bacterium]|nr:ribosome maturation factor RimM [Tissierellia bacterium]
MKDLFLIGTISSTHGLLGAFKLKHNFRKADEIYNYDQVYIFGYEEPFSIERVILRKNSIFLKVKGIDDIDCAEKLINLAVYVDEYLSNEEEERFHESELKGLKVALESGEEVGVVVDIMEGPSQDVLVIEWEGQSAMIPFVKTFVLEMDFDKGKMVIQPIEGLIPWL